MFIPTHRHADGGLYQLVARGVSGKTETEDRWQEGVLYKGEDGDTRWTTNARWEERFERVGDPVITTADIMDDQDEHLVTLKFQTIDVGDVRHMILSAGVQRGSATPPEFVRWIKRVFEAMAEQVSSGLHLREHDFPDLIGDVAAFHAKFGQEYTGKPRMLPQDLHDFRVDFHKEETHEYRDEYQLLAAGVVEKDRREVLHRLEKQLDALADAAWVVLGTADLQFGRKIFYEAWRRVVKANMAKVRKDMTADGDGSVDSGRAPKYDIVKPAGWLPPDHSDLVTDNAIFDGWNETEAEPEFQGLAQEVKA